MRIALVATYTHPVALGLRYVSSYLKHHGHDVRMLFMSSRRDTASADFPPDLLASFLEHVREVDLVGMSLMTNSFVRAGVLTEAIRKAGIRTPIVWGGTHPTVAPQECIEVADMVCVGEGERPLLELAGALEGGKDPSSVDSFWIRRNGSVIRNPLAPLAERLDEHPFPDYDLETHWIAGPREMVPVRPELLRGALHRYRVETTRGCPFHCSFCNNAAWLRITRGKGRWVRRRSVENVIAELEEMCRRFPTIEEVNIVDDLFFIRSEEEIERFVGMYAQRVNLPLEVDAFPNTVTREKVRSLSRLPIALISMGIQSGSADTLKNLYHRPTSLRRIAESIRIFSEAGLKAEYHYLVDNPLEPEENIIETLRFAATHHRPPAIVRVFPLQFYPGTPLYERARAEGVIGRRHESAYHYRYSGKKYLKRARYLDIWLRVVLELRGRGVPPWLVHRMLDVVLNRRVRWAIDRRWFAPLSYRLWRIGRTLSRNLIYQPFVRPFRYLRRKKPSYRELHPEDEVSMPRQPMPSSGTAVAPPAPASAGQPRKAVKART